MSDDAILDFPKGEPIRAQELKARLDAAQGKEWCRLAGVVLRKARPEEALEVVSRREITARWHELAGHLGPKREFWQWVIDLPGEAPPKNGYGVPFSLAAWFWKTQGLSTWTANALAYHRLSSWQELEALSQEDLARLKNVGKRSIARIAELLAARRADCV